MKSKNLLKTKNLFYNEGKYILKNKSEVKKGIIQTTIKNTYISLMT